MRVSVVMTALNEEGNIEAAVAAVLKAFDEFGLHGEIVVVDDGSTDGTGKLVAGLAAKDGRVKALTHDKPMGVGASFWDGVDRADGDAVAWFPGDNENDPRELFRHHRLLERVDIVVPFILNREVRSPLRNALSRLYCSIVNTTFGVSFKYTNGTNLYKRALLKGTAHRSSGFFYQTDILVRAVKKGYRFAEVPCRLGVRDRGRSKAVSVSSLAGVACDYLRLLKHNYFGN